MPPTEIDHSGKSHRAMQNVVVYEARERDAITVITFGLQLYNMVMMPWEEREDINKLFLFRPGELYIVF